MREGEMTKDIRKSFHMFTTLIEVVASRHICVKASQILHLKYVQLIMCQVKTELLKEKCERPNNMWVKFNPWTTSVYPLI